jgi:hypothetical protein
VCRPNGSPPIAGLLPALQVVAGRGAGKFYLGRAGQFVKTPRAVETRPVFLITSLLVIGGLIGFESQIRSPHHLRRFAVVLGICAVDIPPIGSRGHPEFSGPLLPHSLLRTRNYPAA